MKKSVVLTVLGLVIGLAQNSLAQENGPENKSGHEALKTTCYVYVQGSCERSPGLKPFTWIVDSDTTASVDAVRCAIRATEYFNYCNVSAKDPKSAVYTSFQLRDSDGQNKVLLNSYRSRSGAGINGVFSAQGLVTK